MNALLPTAQVLDSQLYSLCTDPTTNCRCEVFMLLGPHWLKSDATRFFAIFRRVGEIRTLGKMASIKPMN